MPELTAKYKMLWFPVDRPYRQRYFFICDCKQTVTFQARLQPAQQKTAYQEKPPVFPFAAMIYPAPELAAN